MNTKEITASQMGKGSRVENEFHKIAKKYYIYIEIKSLQKERIQISLHYYKFLKNTRTFARKG